MLQLTKIFRFETAHAINGYEGQCKNIHGHSYELHVTIRSEKTEKDSFLPQPGFLVDFKDLKTIVKENIVDHFDHCLILSKAYIERYPNLRELENLEIWDVEPSAENILLYILKKLKDKMPEGIYIHNLKIFETSTSYAEWVHEESE